MTVYGATRSKGNKLTYEGRININTAALPILAALLTLDQQELAQSIYDYRAEISKLKNTDALADPAWYKNAPGFSGIKIEPKLLTTRSDIFSIESTASLNEMKMTTFAVVERRKEKKSGKWICKILNWQTK
jgi:type II secretory pathway component PulK